MPRLVFKFSDLTLTGVATSSRKQIAGRFLVGRAMDDSGESGTCMGFGHQTMGMPMALA